MYLCVLYGHGTREESVDGGAVAHVDQADPKGVRDGGDEIQGEYSGS